MITMSQEDQTLNYSNSSSSGNGIGGFGGRSSSKKPKQKKVPQRGLGVAQLERIREQEQQKKDLAIPSSAILPPPPKVVSSSKSSYLPLPIPNFHDYNQPHSSPISLPLSHGNNVPKFWSSYEYDFEKESFEVDPGLAFLPNLPYESNSNPIWPLPNWVQRTQQHQHPSSSVVNISSGTTSSTPAPRYLMVEPPSNQNYSGNCIPLQPEKMIGMKRPYPFSLDVPPPPFNFRIPTFAAPMTINETTSCGSGSGYNNAGNATFRDVFSSSTSNSELNSKRGNGDFLTLAPPTPTSSCPPSNSKSPSTSLAFHNQKFPHLESLSFQGTIEDRIPQLPEFSRFNQQPQHFYTFFPAVAKSAEISQTRARIQNCKGDIGEKIDLNLKQ